MSKPFDIEDEVMYGFVYVILVYCGECCVCFDGCVHIFLCVLFFSHEFLVDQLDWSGQVIEGVVNGLLFLMVFLVSVAMAYV
jgi:hypothetical protein